MSIERYGLWQSQLYSSPWEERKSACKPLASNPPCEQVLAAVGVGCWMLAPLFSTLTPSPVFMAELWVSSYPPPVNILAMLVLVSIGIVILLHQCSSLWAVAHSREVGCWGKHHCLPLPHPCHCPGPHRQCWCWCHCCWHWSCGCPSWVLLVLFHPWSTPQPVAHEAGAVWHVIVCCHNSLPLLLVVFPATACCYCCSCLVVISSTIYPTSSCSWGWGWVVCHLLLVFMVLALAVGAALKFCIGGGCCVSVMWHQ